MMPMHPQHTTTRRAPRAAQTHTCTITCTADDVGAAILDLQQRKQDRWISIALLAHSLGLAGEADAAWLKSTLKQMDSSGHILLSTWEKPQDRPAHEIDWHVQNSSGIPCHLVGLPDELPASITRISPLLRKNAPQQMQLRPEHGTAAVYPRAKAIALSNPRVRDWHITQLVRQSAETLQSLGRNGTGNPRLAKLFTSNGRAAS